MKNLLLVLFTLISGLTVQAQTLVKIYDGTAGYCPQPDPIRWPQTTRFIKAEIQNNQLVVTPVKCDGGKFIIDENLSESNYVMETGIRVLEKHSKFKLFVSTPDFKTYKRIDLPFYAFDKGARINLSELREVGNVVDVAVEARLDYEASNGYKDFNNLRFGAHRILF